MIITAYFHDYMRKFLRRSGLATLISSALNFSFEKKYKRFLLKKIKESDTIFDIGANKGIYTKEFLNKGRRVIAFEPNIECYTFLRNNIHENKEKLKVECLAISDTSGKIRFDSKPNLEATSKVSLNGNVEVDCMQLDEYCSKNVLPDVLKIDVEGHELKILKCSTQTLRKTRVIGVEIHYNLLQKEGVKLPIHEIRSTLKPFGFKTRLIDPSHLIAWK